MAKISMQYSQTVGDVFQDFLDSKTAAGLSPRTIQTYRAHFKVISRFLESDLPLDAFRSQDLRKAVAKMAKTDMSRNSIRSYTATLKSFCTWLSQEGICNVDIGLFKGEEHVPTTYSVSELERLLKRPKKRCDFSEFRTWVIENLLVNNGCRASTIIAMQVQDVDLEGHAIRLRHTKNRKAQTIPLSPDMEEILREYMHHRKGDPEDYLFPTQDNQMMSVSCLATAVRRYNKSRGVKKTGIHAFRHTFARIYLVECNGNALKLQRLLGHSTLAMTQKYVRIYETDLISDFQASSPLTQLKKASKRS